MYNYTSNWRPPPPPSQTKKVKTIHIVRIHLWTRKLSISLQHMCQFVKNDSPIFFCVAAMLWFTPPPPLQPINISGLLPLPNPTVVSTEILILNVLLCSTVGSKATLILNVLLCFAVDSKATLILNVLQCFAVDSKAILNVKNRLTICPINPWSLSNYW